MLFSSLVGQVFPFAWTGVSSGRTGVSSASLKMLPLNLSMFLLLLYYYEIISTTMHLNK